MVEFCLTKFNMNLGRGYLWWKMHIILELLTDKCSEKLLNNSWILSKFIFLHPLPKTSTTKFIIIMDLLPRFPSKILPKMTLPQDYLTPKIFQNIRFPSKIRLNLALPSDGRWQVTSKSQFVILRLREWNPGFYRSRIFSSIEISPFEWHFGIRIPDSVEWNIASAGRWQYIFARMESAIKMFHQNQCRSLGFHLVLKVLYTKVLNWSIIE